MNIARVAGENCRMTWTFPAIIFLFVPLLNMASSRDELPHLKLNSALACRFVRGLTREQRSICHEAPDTASVAFEGLQLAVKECQHQFRWHRWNCTSLLSKSSNPHASALMKRDFFMSVSLGVKGFVFFPLIAHVDVEIYEHGGWETTNNKTDLRCQMSAQRPYTRVARTCRYDQVHVTGIHAANVIKK
ncbi:protein Wnt-10a-like [Zerene cesonia]|uniref:protein Wnt-10a-like n=1 Tax=Zerene cesonia TaxID=33412 RepID=UPI0018E51452|nr:protein Wnt-10a-like [Zerene cesonia]